MSTSHEHRLKPRARRQSSATRYYIYTEYILSEPYIYIYVCVYLKPRARRRELRHARRRVVHSHCIARTAVCDRLVPQHKATAELRARSGDHHRIDLDALDGRTVHPSARPPARPSTATSRRLGLGGALSGGRVGGWWTGGGRVDGCEPSEEAWDGWTDGRMDGWTDGWMDGRMDGRTDGWMDGWMD